MKALIFAAGIGSRLKPWTDHHPKALVDIGGIPILERVINNIKEAGIHEIMVNVHHFADQIKQYLFEKNFGVKIDVSDESDLLLDTGGGLRKIIDWLENKSVLLHNADIYSDVDLREMIMAHNSYKPDATLLSSNRSTSRYFVFDSNNIMKGWTNKTTGAVRPEALTLTPQMSLRAFNGIHIIEPSVYDDILSFKPSRTPFSITDFYISTCCDHKYKSYEMPAQDFWFDVGKPETLELARLMCKNQQTI